MHNVRLSSRVQEKEKSTESTSADKSSAAGPAGPAAPNASTSIAVVGSKPNAPVTTPPTAPNAAASSTARGAKSDAADSDHDDDDVDDDDDDGDWSDFGNPVPSTLTTKPSAPGFLTRSHWNFHLCYCARLVQIANAISNDMQYQPDQLPPLPLPAWGPLCRDLRPRPPLMIGATWATGRWMCLPPANRQQRPRLLQRASALRWGLSTAPRPAPTRGMTGGRPCRRMWVLARSQRAGLDLAQALEPVRAVLLGHPKLPSQ